VLPRPLFPSLSSVVPPLVSLVPQLLLVLPPVVLVPLLPELGSETELVLPSLNVSNVILTVLLAPMLLLVSTPVQDVPVLSVPLVITLTPLLVLVYLWLMLVLSQQVKLVPGAQQQRHSLV